MCFSGDNGKAEVVYEESWFSSWHSANLFAAINALTDDKVENMTCSWGGICSWSTNWMGPNDQV